MLLICSLRIVILQKVLGKNSMMETENGDLGLRY